MFDGRVLVFGSQGESKGRLALTGRKREWLRIATPEVVAPPTPLIWHRAVSELALFNWLLLPTVAATEAVLEGIGAPPGPTLRLATVGRAAEPLRDEGREPEVSSDSLRSTLAAMAGHLGRRQRVLVPHVAGAGQRIGSWLEELGAEAVCCPAYDLDVAAVSRFSLPSGTALISTPSEAERLAAYLRSDRRAGDLPIVASSTGAQDAAEDLGLELAKTAKDGVLGPLETLLDETFHGY